MRPLAGDSQVIKGITFEQLTAGVDKTCYMSCWKVTPLALISNIIENLTCANRLTAYSDFSWHLSSEKSPKQIRYLKLN